MAISWKQIFREINTRLGLRIQFINIYISKWRMISLCFLHLETWWSSLQNRWFASWNQLFSIQLHLIFGLLLTLNSWHAVCHLLRINIALKTLILGHMHSLMLRASSIWLKLRWLVCTTTGPIVASTVTTTIILNKFVSKIRDTRRKSRVSSGTCLRIVFVIIGIIMRLQLGIFKNVLTSWSSGHIISSLRLFWIA